MKQRKRAEKLIKKGKGNKLEGEREREMRVDGDVSCQCQRKKLRSRHYLFRIFLGQGTVISFLFLLHLNFFGKLSFAWKKQGESLLDTHCNQTDGIHVSS